MFGEILSFAGGLLGSSAAGDAADAQAAATAASIAEQRRQFDLTRGDYAPYRAIGTNALRRLGAFYGMDDSTQAQPGLGAGLTEEQIRAILTPQYTTPARDASYGGEGPEGGGMYVPGSPASVRQAELDAAVQQWQGTQATPATAPKTYDDELSRPLQMDPGYQFGMQQGQQAIDRKTSAAGGRVSGASLKAAARFGTDYATTGYNSAYQRRQDTLNRLASLAGIGQSATGASAQAGQNSTNAITQAMQSQGDASGAASLARGSIWQNALNQAGASLQRNWKGPDYWPSNMGQSWSYDK